MRAAIYARYSSDNQRPESIDDQVRSCRGLASQHDLTVDPSHIFTDEAKSGALRARAGLDRLRAAAADGAFETLLIDDLSRLSRDNHYLLTLYAEFRFHGVRILSRADSLDSEDDRSKLGFQMRGIVNELFLDDLREKTLRGQKGQKARGFSVGEATFGYRSEPVGEMRVDRRGRPRPEGYRMRPYPPEVDVVRQIFRDFAGGISIKAIVANLNARGVPGRTGLRKRWSPSTVSRILKNEKYIGRWVWNRTETRRDPLTGRKRRIPKPESEWDIREDEALRIVTADCWEQVTRRWQEVDRVWPARRDKKGSRSRQRSYVETNPPHLLSGLLRCAECGKSMGQVSGKSGGYYGCLGAPKATCDNKLLVRRTIAEKCVLAAVRERVSDAASIRYVLERVEIEVKRLHADVPEALKLTRGKFDVEERRVANFIEFIAEGKGTKALGQALEEAEREVDRLRVEIGTLEATAEAVFEAPPIEWIAERLRPIGELLRRQTTRSALVLRRVLGPVRLRPVRPEVGKPYYQAETALEVLDLLAQAESSEGGSNWSQQWRRGESKIPWRVGLSTSQHFFSTWALEKSSRTPAAARLLPATGRHMKESAVSQRGFTPLVILACVAACADGFGGTRRLLHA
ncbi:MAG: recombinase family protein [Candidatus Binatia bacterium]|nr:recombinase family protein [Candidatus Binatia bacterium]